MLDAFHVVADCFGLIVQQVIGQESHVIPEFVLEIRVARRAHRKEYVLGALGFQQRVRFVFSQSRVYVANRPILLRILVRDGFEQLEPKIGRDW